MLKRSSNEETDDKLESRSISEASIRPIRSFPHLEWAISVAIQLDANSFQYCVAKKSPFGTKILDYSKIYLPKDKRTKENRQEFLSSEISHLVESFPPCKAKYTLVVDGENAVFRVFDLPQMPATELAKAVFFEGEKRTPFLLEEAHYGHRAIEKKSSASTKQITVALSAITREHLQSLTDLFGTFGIKFEKIHLDAEVMGHLLSLVPDFNINSPYGILNIKPQGSDFAFYRGDALKFLHRSSVGSEQLHLSNHMADVDSNALPRELERFAKTLAFEAESCLDYYSAQGSADSLDRFFVVGDLTYSDEIVKGFTERFGISFTPFPVDCLKRYFSDPSAALPGVAGALSVIASAVSSQEFCDLAPQKTKLLRQRSTFIRRSLTLSLGALALVGVLVGGALLKRSYAFEQKQALAKAVEDIESSSGFALSVVLERQLALHERLVKDLSSNSGSYHLMMKELSSLTPETVELRFFEYLSNQTNSRPLLTGIVTSKTIPPEIILADYIFRLESSPVFSNVILESESKHRKGSSRMITFTIRLDALT